MCARVMRGTRATALDFRAIGNALLDELESTVNFEPLEGLQHYHAALRSATAEDVQEALRRLREAVADWEVA